MSRIMILLSALFLGLAAGTAVASEQLRLLLPNPTAEDDVILEYRSPYFQCPYIVNAEQVSRVGELVSIHYVASQFSRFSCLPPPLPNPYHRRALGRLPAGQYVVKAAGTVDGSPHAFPDLLFTVHRAGSGAAIVPALDPMGLGLLVFIMLGFGCLRRSSDCSAPH